MADAHAAAQDPDRLPWLTESRRPLRPTETPWLFWAFLAIVLVAGISYWLGVKSVHQPDEFDDILGRTPVVTERLPELTNEAVGPVPPAAERVQAPGLRDVDLVPDPQPVPIPGVDRARPVEPAPEVEARPEVAAEPAEAETDSKEAAAPAEPAAKPVAAPRPRLQAWPADQSTGAYGRVVRVGTFYNRQQAKQGWSRIVRVYPGLRRLNAVVVPNPSLRNGQMYYRLQFGTTSQAHSAVLCQRMRVVGLSCVTVGLPAGGAR